MRFLVKLLLFVFILAAVFAAFLWFQKPEVFTSPVARQEVIQQAQSKAEELKTEAIAQIVVQGMKLKLTFPQKVDEMMSLTDIRAESTAVIYEMEINLTGEQFNMLMTNITQNMSETACSREDYRKMLSFGLTVVLDIRSVDGTHGKPIAISPEGCGITPQSPEDLAKQLETPATPADATTTAPPSATAPQVAPADPKSDSSLPPEQPATPAPIQPQPVQPAPVAPQQP